MDSQAGSGTVRDHRQSCTFIELGCRAPPDSRGGTPGTGGHLDTQMCDLLQMVAVGIPGGFCSLSFPLAPSLSCCALLSRLPPGIGAPPQPHGGTCSSSKAQPPFTHSWAWGGLWGPAPASSPNSKHFPSCDPGHNYSAFLRLSCLSCKVGKSLCPSSGF